MDPKWVQHGSKNGPKQVQNEFKMSPRWVSSGIYHSAPIFDPQVTPLGPPTCPKMVPKWVQKSSKLGQKWVPEINVDFYWFFVSFLIKNWSKNRCVFDDFLARALLQPTCENLQKPLKNQWFLMIFLVLSDQKVLKNLSKMHLSKLPPNDVHFGLMLRSKIDQKWSQVGPKTGKKTIKKQEE